jgi:hypothetical protein
VEQETIELSAVQGNVTLSFDIPPFDWLELQDLGMDNAAGRRLEERAAYETWRAQFVSEVAGWVAAAAVDEGTISVLSVTFNDPAAAAAAAATCAATSCAQSLVHPCARLYTATLHCTRTMRSEITGPRFGNLEGKRQSFVEGGPETPKRIVSN